MKSIRIGNDIRIEWPIVLSGDVSKLQDLDLTVEVRPSAKIIDTHNYADETPDEDKDKRPVFIKTETTVMMNGGITCRPDIGDGKEHCRPRPCPPHPHRPVPPAPVRLPYHIEDNTLIAMWTADRQFATGDYDIILYAHKNEGGQAVCDQYRFVRLVSHTAQADAPDDSGIEAVIAMQPVTLELSGLSAYEVAVVNGFQGTEEEWLQSLKQPAIDAAEQAKKDIEQFKTETKTELKQDIDNLNANTGVDDYEAFSESKAYTSGDVVNYNGKLYKFTSDHAVGAWMGTDVEKWNLKTYIKDLELDSQINDFSLNGQFLYTSNKDYDIPVRPLCALSIKIRNKSNEKGYYNIVQRNSQDTIIVEKGTVLLDELGSDIYNVTTNESAISIGIININSINIQLDISSKKQLSSEVEGLSSEVEDLSSEVEDLSSEVEDLSSEVEDLSFIANDDLTINGNYNSKIVKIKPNTTYTITLTNKNDSGYYSVQELNYDKNILQEIINLSSPLAKDEVRTVKFISDRNSNYVKIVNINSRIYEFNINEWPDVHTLLDCDIQSTQINNITNVGYNTSFNIPSSAWNVQFTWGNVEVKASDFIYVSMEINPSIDCWLNITTYTVATQQRTMLFFFKGNKKRRIVFRSLSQGENGTLNVLIGQNSEILSSGNQIYVENFVACVNHYDAYFDEYTKSKYIDINDRTFFIVDKNGDGDFIGIKEAVNLLHCYLGDTNTEKELTIFVKNGVYDKEQCPYYAMDVEGAILFKGNNKISIIGESTDGVIIPFTQTKVCHGKILDICASPCIVKNISIYNYCGDDFTNEIDNNPSYCVHIESNRGEIDGEQYYTTLENCRLYSETRSPLGTGISKNQIICLKNCDIIVNSSTMKDNISNAAFSVHGRTEGNSDYDSTFGLELIRNRFVSLSRNRALNIVPVSNSNFSQAKVDFLCNFLYSNGTELLEKNNIFNGMTPYSMGNNEDTLNYITRKV